MSQLLMKTQAAKAALEYICDDIVLGIGTGSTINCLIELLPQIKYKIKAAVASSITTEKLLRAHDIDVVDFTTVDTLQLYIDGADSYNSLKQLIKGGGGALTREKILAYASKKFICLVDTTKQAEILGKFPVPLEVLPMARSYVAREIVKLGGHPALRQNFITDNGNIIIDVHHWEITQPIALETTLNNIPGVISCGIFAQRTADLIIIGHADKTTSI